MIWVLELVEAVLAVVFVLLIVTQIVIPAARGMALFPALRSRRRAVSLKMIHAREAAEVRRLQADLDALKHSDNNQKEGRG